MSVLQAVRAKGPRVFADRVVGLPGRFGISTARMDERLHEYVELCREFGAVPTLPVTAVVLDRHADVARRLVRDGVEFAVHGLVHNDHLAADAGSQLTSVAAAVGVFHRHEVPVVGFRAPYLRADHRTRRAVQSAGLLYDSSQAVVYPVLPPALTEPANGPYARALDFYGANRAGEVVVRPRLLDGVVSLPVALPDDEMLVDRLRLGPDRQLAAWSSVLRAVHERGELFTVQLHPERLPLCRTALRGTLQEASTLPGGVWIAPLREVAHWWRSRARTRVQVERIGPCVQVVVEAPPGVVVQLLRRATATGPLRPDPAALVASSRLSVERDPVIALTPDAPGWCESFLRDEGFLVVRGARPDRCGASVQSADATTEQELLAHVLAGAGPLVRTARWPHGRTAALAVTGDIDSLTLVDFARRQIETRHPTVPRQRSDGAPRPRRQPSRRPKQDTVVVGAGPYGLAVTAHLAHRGHAVRVLGDPMSFWETRMPRGMLLRSPWAASHIADPEERWTLDAYCAATGLEHRKPLPLENFVAYGRWVQRQVAPQLENRQVRRIEAEPGGFVLDLEDGDRLTARRVVVATGIDRFAAVPPVVAGLPRDLVSHSRDHRDLGVLAGQSVVVLGAGQSALESAALLHEAGAEVTVVVRAPVVHWLGRSARLHALGPVTRMLYAPSDVGPAGVSRLVAAPDVFRRMPRRLQDPLARRSIRPAGSAWLPDRLGSVRILTGRSVTASSVHDGRVRLDLDDGSRLGCDHVLAATGYRVDIRRLDFLGPELLAGLALAGGGFPRLGAGFESTVPGLHFVGAPAAWSFGPLMRFVAGTTHTGRSLARRLDRRAVP
jgi:NADPH-dependent 2,4-dienoyl-CoA reductase/sulfur reductase-like enzyme